MAPAGQGDGPGPPARGRRPRHLIRDRDRVHGSDLRHRKARGLDTVLIPARPPRANAVAERLIGTLRRDGLDHVIPVDERHPRSILAEYVAYHNRDRPHRALSPGPSRPPPLPRAGPIGAVRARPVLNGLHHGYERAA